MQRWEYIVLGVAWGDYRQVHTVNNRELGDRPNVYDYILRLGDEGWELVGVGQGQLYFKRPKSG
jgi:hypothetical protein